MVYFGSLLLFSLFLFICVPKHVQLQFRTALACVLSFWCTLHACLCELFSHFISHADHTIKDNKRLHVDSHFAYFKRLKQRHYYLHTLTPFRIFYITLATKFPAVRIFHLQSQNRDENSTQETQTHAQMMRAGFLSHVLVGVLVLLVALQVFSVDQCFDAALDHLCKK